jgi:hypothetical protein
VEVCVETQQRYYGHGLRYLGTLRYSYNNSPICH